MIAVITTAVDFHYNFQKDEYRLVNRFVNVFGHNFEKYIIGDAEDIDRKEVTKIIEYLEIHGAERI